MPRGSLDKRLYDGLRAACSNHDHLGGPVDDTVGYPRDRTGRGSSYIQGLLKGDVVFTNLEGAIAQKGETVCARAGDFSLLLNHSMR